MVVVVVLLLTLIELLIVFLLLVLLVVVVVLLPFSSLLLMLLLRGFGGTAGGTEEFFEFPGAAAERLILPLLSVVFILSGDIDRVGPPRASVGLMSGEDLAEAEGLNFKRPK